MRETGGVKVPCGGRARGDTSSYITPPEYLAKNITHLNITHGNS